MATKTKSVAATTPQDTAIRDYARFYESNRLVELSVETKTFKLTLKKQQAAVAPVALPRSAAAGAPVVAAEKSSEEPPVRKSTGKEVKSPIVGTFYASPSPDSPPYVKVGDDVEATAKVCIVEAMKNMNEITAGVSGRVAEILVKNGQPVQAGQVLMILE